MARTNLCPQLQVEKDSYICKANIICIPLPPGICYLLGADYSFYFLLNVLWHCLDQRGTD